MSKSNVIFRDTISRALVCLVLPLLVVACAGGDDANENNPSGGNTSSRISISSLSTDDFEFLQDTGPRSDKVYGSMDFYLVNASTGNYIRDLADAVDSMSFLERDFGTNDGFTIEVEATQASEINVTPVLIHYLIDISYSVVEAGADDELVASANTLVNDIRATNNEPSTSPVNYRTFGDTVSASNVSNSNLPFSSLVFEPPGGGTALYQAISASLDDLVALPGSVLFLFTDGRENASQPGYTIGSVIQKAQDNEIPIYIAGLGANVDAAALGQIASATEGDYFQASNTAELEEAFQSLLDRIPVKYTAIYRPTQRSGHVEFQFRVTYGGSSDFITDDFDVDAILGP